MAMARSSPAGKTRCKRPCRMSCRPSWWPSAIARMRRPVQAKAEAQHWRRLDSPAADFDRGAHRGGVFQNALLEDTHIDDGSHAGGIFSRPGFADGAHRDRIDEDG